MNEKTQFEVNLQRIINISLQIRDLLAVIKYLNICDTSEDANTNEMHDTLIACINERAERIRSLAEDNKSEFEGMPL